ncbi:MAG: hypothetical protein IPN20_23735 [Haliscomenobacter sp.]|nr:hypothetical protein [Haliscomenobacter sp.]
MDIDKKLFLDIFEWEPSEPSSGEVKFYEFDPVDQKKVREVSIDEKISKVIKEVIFRLSNGEPIEFKNDGYNKTILKKDIPTQNIRTICLLIGLQKYLSESENLKNLKNKLKRNKIQFKLSLTVKHENQENQEGSLAEGEVMAKWNISYPLLLIQITRFSQIEWGNQDYNFEYFSAKRGFQFFNDFFTKRYFKESTKENQEKGREILKVIYNSIRWFSLNGQFIRSSSKFNSLNNKLGLGPAEKMLLDFDGPLFCADKFLRENEFENEKKIRRKILEGTDFIFDEFNMPVCNSNIIGETAKDDELFLFSNLAVHFNNDNGGSSSFNNSIQNNLISKTNNNKKEGVEEKGGKIFRHYVFDKIQRDKGVLNKLFKHFGKDLDYTEFDDYLDIHCHGSLPIIEDQPNSPEEKVYLVFIKPEKVLELIYSFSVSKDEPKNAIEFIHASFKHASEKYDGKLPLPVVHFILKLLPYYNTKLINSEEPKRIKSFPVNLIFDGNKNIEFWLPDVEKTEDFGDGDNKTVSIKEVIQRFILYYITNYGMILEYKKVDIDLSASKFGYWYDLITNINEKEKLGIHIFEKYLEECGANILTTTYAVELYDKYIIDRKLFDYHIVEADRNQKRKLGIKNMLNDKFLLGIDIGATGIKMRFFKILELGQERNGESEKYKFLELHFENENKELEIIKYFLIPEPYEYAIPTSRGNSDSDKYLDADDFANYLCQGLKEQVDYSGSFIKESEDKWTVSWGKYVNNLISIGLAWPGPIKQNKIATTSGIMKYFRDMTPFIYKAEKTKINHIQISEAVEMAFGKYRDDNSDGKILVTLANDGNVEASGFVFGRLQTSVNRNSENYLYVNKLKDLIRGSNVAIIKAGTGTAGAILENGNVIGLNEFGKLIVDLYADNSMDKKSFEEGKIEYIFPRGDLNKFFSINFLREVAEKAGVPKNASHRLSGRDLGLLFEGDSGSSAYELIKSIDDNKAKLFGVLELMDIIKPKIKWSQVVKGKKISSKLTLESDGKDNFYCKMFSPK